MIPFVDLAPDAQAAVVARYYDLFAGRLDAYAIRMPGAEKHWYAPSTYDGNGDPEKRGTVEKVQKVVRAIGTPEFGDEAVRAHLSGQELLGGYPIRDDSTVRWFALDFDGDTPEAAWAEAVAQATILIEAGLVVYIERSQSGNGFHIWGFLDAPMNAGRVRHALSPLIERVETYDRMFPNQNGVNPLRPLGNLIALPFHGGRLVDGNSAFVRRGPRGEPIAVEDPWTFLDQIRTNSVEHLETLFEEAGQFVPDREPTAYEGDAEGLWDSFKLTHPVFGCEFVRWCWEHPDELKEPLWYALLCNFAQFEDGRALAHRWSARDELRYNQRQTDRKYDQAVLANKPHSCEVIRGLGGHCECDARFPGKVYAPFHLARLPFRQLVDTVSLDDAEGVIVDAEIGFDRVIQRLEEIERDPEAGQGYKYGIPCLDRATRMRDSDLVLVAARSGMGKTSFAGSVMDYGAINGVPQYFFSAEMAASQFWQRQLSVRACVSQTRMSTGQLTGEDWKKIRNAREETRDRARYPIFVDDMSRSTDRIFEVAARLVHKHGKGVVWIDYLQLLQRLPRESMFDAVTRIVHELKLLAKALGVPVVALAQLNRTADDATGDSTTQDSMLRGSGDLEMTSDVIWFLLGDKGPGVRKRVAALHKERHREAGLRFDLEFNQPLMRYAEAGTWGTYDDEDGEPRVVRRPGAPPRVDETEQEDDGTYGMRNREDIPLHVPGEGQIVECGL